MALSEASFSTALMIAASPAVSASAISLFAFACAAA